MLGVPRMLAVNAVAHPGGAEIGLRRLIDRLSGWDVTVAGPDELPVGGLGAREGTIALRSFPKARRLARRHDVVYLNGTVAGRLLPAVAGAARTVLHVHDLVDRVPRFWRRADVILADSEAVADRLEGLEAHVVGCPVELDAEPAPAPWTRGAGPVVGYVGRIEPRKGVLDLVRAAPEIRRRVPGAEVVVVGSDAYGADPGYGAEVAAASDVQHVGWVDNAPSLMSHLDLLVLPSYAEPFGTVLAEALAAGTPVVATAVGGLPEVVRDGVDGVLVPPGRPDALAGGVVRALERREELAAHARSGARRFDADVYARRVEELIAP
jgi:glycosyltransferase involved in cell wall biosynthesis